MEHNPEQSPYFSHYETEYRTAFHKLFGAGDKKAYFHDEMPLDKVNEWAGHQSHGAVVSFVESNPGLLVTQEIDGEMKTVTLPFWARDEYEANPETYYGKSAWVYRCVDIKAKAAAAVEWNIYPENPQKAEDDVEPKDETDPAVMLLNEVNPEDNWPDLISKVFKDLDLYGKAFVQKIYKKDGDGGRTEGKPPILLQRLNPSVIEVVGDDKGIKKFRHKKIKDLEYERDEILYFRGYDPRNDIGSISPLDACKHNVQIEIHANEHLSDFFANNAMPALIMSSPNNVGETALKFLTGMWRREFGSKGKRGRTTFMDNGFEPKQLNYPLNQLALEEIRNEARKSICAAFGVPPTLAGAWEAANFATAETGRSSLYTETIIPQTRYIQGVLNAELMDEFGDQYFFRFEPENLDVMQEDTGARATWISLLVEKRIIKPEVGAVEMGFSEEDVPEPMPVPDFGMQNGNLSNENSNERSTDDETKTERYSADLMVDLNKWRRKCINRVRKNKTAFCAFESDYIPGLLTNVIEHGLKDAETVDEIHEVFNGANTKTDKRTFVNVTIPEREAKIENIVNVPESKQDIVVNVPEQKPPDVKVNVEAPNVKVDAPEVQVINPKIDVNVPKVVHSKEEQKVNRDARNLIKGSETETTYTYDDE